MKQFYKSVYFADFPADSNKEKSITLAFSEPEEKYYKKVKKLSSEEIRQLTGIENYTQLSLFAQTEERSLNQTFKRLLKKELNKNFEGKEATFMDSKNIPFQRWYPYIEGYSLDFVQKIIQNYSPNAQNIYEPFAGTGTTIFATDSYHKQSYFSEVNPLLRFLIQSKIQVLQLTNVKRLKLAQEFRKIQTDIFKNLKDVEQNQNFRDSFSAVFGKSKYFPDDTFEQILQLKTYIQNLSLENKLLASILNIALFSIFLPISYLKKAGDVRFKNEKELLKSPPLSLEDTFLKKIQEMIADIENMDFNLQTKPELILHNAKNIGLLPPLKIDTVITSPPYLNGTNYFRNTKLELWFLGILKSKNDLRYFRNQALTSGINDVSKGKYQDKITHLESNLFQETFTQIQESAYDSRIPVMIENYFAEMQEIFKGLQKHLEPKAKILIDIGDSIFANVHIQTDDILVEVLEDLGYHLQEKKHLRKRRSRNKTVLSQTLLFLEYTAQKKQVYPVQKSKDWEVKWKNFRDNLPYQQAPFSKKNWGNSLHSLCSYQGKLKPAIAYHLVDTFVPENGKVLDCFSGVGTIPFEASLQGKQSFGIDINFPAYLISSAKVQKVKANTCWKFINTLKGFIQENQVSETELAQIQGFGFNKKITEYYHEDTFAEILLARKFLQTRVPQNASEMLVWASLLHILHGNRPYALSRRSHSIVPYAPTGDFEYKNLIEKLSEKVKRSLAVEMPKDFAEGKIFHQNITELWDFEIQDLDAIITSPPFFDSTRFYLANWIRMWFAGWDNQDFKQKPIAFIEEQQKTSFEIYKSIFRQAKERLKKEGIMVLHLGKSKKCDMAEELQKMAKYWFKTVDLFDESVAHCESHGIRDKGTVTSHQYLILQ